MKTLLLIDIQNDYFSGGANPLSGAEKSAENAGRILAKFRADGLPVIFIKHLSVRPGSTFFLPETDGAEINDAVKPRADETVIEKHFPNSFRETGLKEFLDSHGIKEIVVCGMMTHMCVDATVRAAKDYGYDVTLIHDACATKDLMIDGVTVKACDVHNSFVAAMNYYYAEAVTTDKYLNQ
ncbi:MAG: cysteine hydrolase [Bacteroidetes bacterium]|nr:cysteine hydrolase [Bacteroidota bacterium]